MEYQIGVRYPSLQGMNRSQSLTDFANIFEHDAFIQLEDAARAYCRLLCTSYPRAPGPF
jgi:hypothetical protein